MIQKILRDRFLLKLVIVEFILIMAITFLDNYPRFLQSTTVEAQSQSLERLQLQTYKTFTTREAYATVIVVCDTANGNLVYSTGYQGGVAVVPNSCQKNPR